MYAGGRHGIGHSIRGLRFLDALNSGQRNGSVLISPLDPLFLNDNRVVQLHAAAQYLADQRRSSSARYASPQPRPLDRAACASEVLATYRSVKPSAFFSTQFDGLTGELEYLLPVMRNDGVQTTLLLRDFQARSDFEFLGAGRFSRILELYDRVFILGSPNSRTHLHPVIERRVDLGSAQFVGYVGPPTSTSRLAEQADRETDDARRILIHFGGGLGSETALIAILGVLGRAASRGAPISADVIRGPFSEGGRAACRRLPFVRMLSWRPGGAPLAGYDLTISRAGYNSAVEAYIRETPTLLLPWEASSEEQTHRARLVAQMSNRVVAARAAPCILEAIVDCLERSWWETPLRREPLLFFGSAQRVALPGSGLVIA